MKKFLLLAGLALVLAAIFTSCDKASSHDADLVGKWEVTLQFSSDYSIYTSYDFKSNGKMQIELGEIDNQTGEKYIESTHGKWHTADGYLYVTVFVPEENQYKDWDPARYHVVRGEILILYGNIQVIFQKVK